MAGTPINCVIVHGISLGRETDWWHLWAKAVAIYSRRIVRAFPVYWEDLMSANGHQHQKSWREPRQSGWMADLLGDVQSLWDDEVMERIAIQIDHVEDESDGELWVIGHSQGTALTYRYLHEMTLLQCHRWITVGSPLRRYSRAGLVGVLTKPTSVQTWHNVWGRWDVVTHGPISQRLVSGAIAAADYNHMSWTRHDAESYVASSAFRAAVVER